MIETRNLNVRAGSFALHDVAFVLPAQAFGVVVGAAGAGKTTLLETIAGVRVPSSGSVHLAGRDVTHVVPEHRAIGLVYQRGALFPHRCVPDNIAWSTSSRSLMAPIVARLGLESLLTTPVTSLSGGERQLVALARALVRVRDCLDRGEPAVLLLDEPFSALDPRRRRQTRDIVRSFHADWNLTTLQVTHDGHDAARADVAVLLDAGRVVQWGSPNELLARPAREDVPLFLGADI